MTRTLKSPTIYDVADLAGVSSATVSYVLSGRRSGQSRISDETRERVLEAIEALGYVPDQTARSLRRRRTERVCLLVPRLGVPYYDLIGREMQQVADAHGYSVIIQVAGSADTEQFALDQLRRRLADGVLIVTPSYIDASDIEPLVNAGVSVVVWSNNITPKGFDVWQSTEDQAGRDAVNYLVDKGHQRIAFLGHFSNPYHQRRLQIWKNALADRKISVDPGLIFQDNWSREGAYRATRVMLQLQNRPTAILASSDIAAVSAVWVIRESGLRIPEDIAVIGNGNIPEGEAMYPPLTTVGPDYADHKEMIELLFRHLAKPRPVSEGVVHQHTWRLILRGSA